MMTFRSANMLAGVALLAVTANPFDGQPAQALTMQQCSEKYKAAQAAKTLDGLTWQNFRKTHCGPDAATTSSAAPPAATASPPKSVGALNRSPDSSKAVFPRAISPTYAKESAGKARMHTCLDQYRANKATNGNAGLKWTEKGGGYYSECTKRLKG